MCRADPEWRVTSFSRLFWGPDEPGPTFSYVLRIISHDMLKNDIHTDSLKHIHPFNLTILLRVLGSSTVVMTKLYLLERKLSISPSDHCSL
jgi:hypothetical protein